MNYHLPRTMKKSRPNNKLFKNIKNRIFYTLINNKTYHPIETSSMDKTKFIRYYNSNLTSERGTTISDSPSGTQNVS